MLGVYRDIMNDSLGKKKSPVWVLLVILNKEPNKRRREIPNLSAALGYSTDQRTKIPLPSTANWKEACNTDRDLPRFRLMIQEEDKATPDRFI